MAQGGEKEGGQEALEALLASREAFITYVPLRGEVPFLDYCALPENAVVHEIAPRASLSPAAEAAKAVAAAEGRETAVLIPGRAFDASGTRHGQGGGWYDRFLAAAPREWLRVGFCFERQFSTTPLRREAWDEEMDAVVVVDESGMRLYGPGL